jgi:hypothetical protein
MYELHRMSNYEIDLVQVCSCGVCDRDRDRMRSPARRRLRTSRSISTMLSRRCQQRPSDSLVCALCCVVRETLTHVHCVDDTLTHREMLLCACRVARRRRVWRERSRGAHVRVRAERGREAAHGDGRRARRRVAAVAGMPGIGVCGVTMWCDCVHVIARDRVRDRV